MAVAESKRNSPPQRSWFMRTLISTVRGAFDRYNSLTTRYSPLGDRVFFSTSDFPFVDSLEANWLTIRADLQRVIDHTPRLPDFSDLSKDQIHLTPPESWKTFFFYAYGHQVVANCEQCPETTKIIERIPGMKTALFSILKPGVRIAPHRGAYKGVLRCHLGLWVPAPPDSCGIRVGDQIEHWQEGKCMIFDDSYEHEAWNNSDHDRAVLFLDIERPLPRLLSGLNRALIWVIKMSPQMRDGIKNYEKMTERESATHENDNLL